MSISAKLTFPKSIDITEDIELHGEDVVVISDYTLEGTCKQDLFINWKYQNDSDYLHVTGQMNSDNLNVYLNETVYGVEGLNDLKIKGAGAQTDKTELGERLLEIIAYTLFKHPLAKAPISNDTIIKAKQNDISVNVKNQFDNDDAIRKSLVEQLLQQDPSRFENKDTFPVDVPIKQNDVIQFLINYGGKTKNNQNTPQNSENINFSIQSTEIGKSVSFSILVKLNIL